MARTIKETAEEIKVAFVRNATLRNLYQLEEYDADGDDATHLAYYDSYFSTISVETCLIYAIAACMATMENLFDWFKKDVQTVVDKERYGYAGWYAKKMKAFRYGQDIENDYSHSDVDFAEGTEYPDTGLTASEIEELQIVKYASALDSGREVIIKIAKDDGNGSPTPLSSSEAAMAEAYINRIKPAGIPLTIVNENADELDVSVKIVYNPLIFGTDTEVENAVATAIKSYLNSIEFNGQFVGMTMIDHLQTVEGIEIAQVNSLLATHAGHPAEDITGDTYYTPQSGYLTLRSLEVIIEK